MQIPAPVTPLPTGKIRRGDVRRQELLQEAARILLRDGISRTSMDLIATEARASKATLYRHFGDKHRLVVEVVAWLCEDFVQDVPVPGPEIGMCAALMQILEGLTRVLDKPGHPDFFRLVVEGARIDPAIGRAWYDNGPQFWHGLLRDVITRARASGEIPATARTERYPELLFDAVFADRIIRTAVLAPGDSDAVPNVEGSVLETLVGAVEAAIRGGTPFPPIPAQDQP
ncbi:TetR/AcrR family transcriptional regulator [Xinfangfangia sp. D13-10-4-6]|uniref:TetR/AcrR family transcriptional regulator n=1 Tax=Pseudogemmobacter hezensis TaxID=2737662 RepID=UPI001553F14D|nr:TetR/AcrR family transcriptional regulator [Pseudogemmobacter hezensis]NPD14819.1 TetR/AcrR family transcriptional regulator [Pseudogemmobacter hezensis]